MHRVHEDIVTEKKSNQTETDKITLPTRWAAVFWIALGWVIGGAIVEIIGGVVMIWQIREGKKQ